LRLSLLTVLGAVGLLAQEALRRRRCHPLPLPSVQLQLGKRRQLSGIGVQEVNAERAKELKLPDVHGVEVTGWKRTARRQGGLKENDVVLEYQGQRVEGTAQFQRLVKERPRAAGEAAGEPRRLESNSDPHGGRA